jgi:DNA-binding transcriptional MocR family regulator
MTAAKYRQVADRVRGQIEDGMLLPGEPAPSGAALSRATGYSTLTCRKGLRTLIREGVLIPGARPRVPSRGLSPGARSSTGAARGSSVRRRVLIPSIPQVLRLAEALDHFKPGLGDVAMVMAFTGLRWEEAVAVPVENVDLDGQWNR